jgi:hypothetical protein
MTGFILLLRLPLSECGSSLKKYREVRGATAYRQTGGNRGGEPGVSILTEFLECFGDEIANVSDIVFVAGYYFEGGWTWPMEYR